MRRAGIYLQFGDQFFTHAIFGEHPLDRMPDNPLGFGLAEILEFTIAFAASPSGVEHVCFIFLFVA
jgi:hypothetical protein